MSLATGHAGTPHVTAAQAAGLQAGIIGPDDYVLDRGSRFAITVVSANKVTIGSGELVMQGYHASNDAGVDLIITNGAQGMKRRDLIVCRYEKGSDSVESARLVVVKGTATTGTPADPALNTTSMWNGGTTYDMPLYRIPLDGITIGKPVPLFNLMQPMSAVWDSLSHTDDYASKLNTRIGEHDRSLAALTGRVKTGTYIGSCDKEGFCLIANPFNSTAVAVFYQLMPNQMTDALGKRCLPLPWDVTASRFRCRLRNEVNQDWIAGVQPVRINWVAFRTVL
ncbi:hypothetical protein [Bifidobacterium catulorum]|uniref:Uncharacterized protein n=1 Tax=Bifidobacterium catulorum TaxID=1630173 RepID=A0A2U2MUF3_9BIFI|nr:hypothetical protein [Bifidobacterium catulorum]PWG60508.1 hypothetical protein DF200_02635 [Bifidobacterium catulorum]